MSKFEIEGIVVLTAACKVPKNKNLRNKKL